MARQELKIQAHICDSYRIYGGYAVKWDAAHAKGKPDLICSMPGVGVHFIEVKHRPEVAPNRTGAIKNPMEPRQVSEAVKIMRAGGRVFGGLVVGGARTVSESALGLFDPLSEVWYLHDAQWAEWSAKGKFNMLRLLQEWRKT